MSRTVCARVVRLVVACFSGVVTCVCDVVTASIRVDVGAGETSTPVVGANARPSDVHFRKEVVGPGEGAIVTNDDVVGGT